MNLNSKLTAYYFLLVSYLPVPLFRVIFQIFYVAYFTVHFMILFIKSDVLYYLISHLIFSCSFILFYILYYVSSHSIIHFAIQYYILCYLHFDNYRYTAEWYFSAPNLTIQLQSDWYFQYTSSEYKQFYIIKTAEYLYDYLECLWWSLSSQQICQFVLLQFPRFSLSWDNFFHSVNFYIHVIITI